jgi:hypothetical protein
MQSRCLLQLALCLLIGAVASVGCSGSDTTGVHGKVTFNGQPLADGDISFTPEPPTSLPQSSAPIKNGEYSIGGEWGLGPATYKVRINGYRPSTDKNNMLAGGHLDMPPETPGIPRREQFLSKKFNTETTLAKLVVKPGESEVEQNYDLKE